MVHPSLATFTAILRPPLELAGRSRQWSAHCLDLNLGVQATSAPAVRRLLASTIAAEVSGAERPPLPPRRAVDPCLWDAARKAPVVVRQYVETDVGPIEVCYVQPPEPTGAPVTTPP